MKKRTVNWFERLPLAKLEKITERFGTPLYLYDAETIRARCRALTEAFPYAQIRYAMKANSNPSLLALIRKAGIGVDAVSAWEVRLAREVGFPRRAVIYSGSNPSDDELRALARENVTVNLDALSAIERYGRIRPGGRVSFRLNLDLGAGHHPHVITAGPESKFGLSAEDLPQARSIAKRHGLRVRGLHQHIGSGLSEPSVFLDAAERLFAVARTIPSLRFVDVGGGFGVPYRPEDRPVDLMQWGRGLKERFERLQRDVQKPLKLLIEPGRYVVAESGVLITRVTTIKRARDRVFVGVDGGMHSLIRPAMYGSHHPIHSLPQRRTEPERCFVVGPICESGDVLAEDRLVPVPHEGDLLAVGCAGAYGYAMASQYNLRARPAEVLIDGSRVRRIRDAERYGDVVPERAVRLARR